MYRFHANFYARLPDLALSAPIELRGILLSPLVTSGGATPTFADFLPVAFEETLDRLRAIPSVDAEPDGFFVCSGLHGAENWRVSGHLFDFGDRMHRLEMNGDCPAEVLDLLWQSIGWPQAKLACELVREGVVLEEASFRLWASAGVR